MTQSSQQSAPVVHRLAIVTCVVALLPISIGALVTTLEAGMAFADWPTSDGVSMLRYPWLQDLRNPEKFTEHGHRLAGMVIGLMTIVLVVVTFLRDRRRWVRVYSLTILAAVIAQGLLGGARVLLDASVLAMVHSITGALFFTQCVAFALLTRRTSSETTLRSQDVDVSVTLRVLTCMLPVLVIAQYVLGGLFRHLDRMMFEHLAGAAIVAMAGLVCSAGLMRSRRVDLKHAGRLIMVALLVQLGLGVGAWVTKLNVPALGWVVHTGSPASVVLRSLHTVGGMFLLAAAAMAAIRMVRAMEVNSFVDQAPQLPGVRGGLA